MPKITAQAHLARRHDFIDAARGPLPPPDHAGDCLLDGTRA